MTTAPSPARTLTERLLEMQLREPEAVPRRILWIVCALFGALLTWALVAQLDVVAVAEGQLVPQTYVKVVQPAEAGIVREILVREGDTVEAGQPLIRLDATYASADRRSVGTQLSLKRLEQRRVEAQLAGQPLSRETEDPPGLFAQVQMDAAARQRSHLDLVAQEEATRARLESELLAATETLGKLQRTLPSYEEAAKAYQSLADQKLVGRLLSDEKQREAVEQAQDLKAQAAHVQSLRQALRAQQGRLDQLGSEYASELQSEAVDLAAEIAQLEEEATKQGFREGLLELKAPQDGVVKELATTTVGAVVQPGTVIVTLVPKNDALVGEVYVKNQDIGFVREGQPVRIKLSAYPFTRYGMLEGTVQTISADASRLENGAEVLNDDEDDEREISPFKVLVRLDNRELIWNGRVLPIAAGMQVQAEIRQEQRTVMEYLLSPVKKVAHEAGVER